jgi:hypothetical protein
MPGRVQRQVKKVTHVRFDPTWVTFSMTVLKNVTHVWPVQTWVTFFRR